MVVLTMTSEFSLSFCYQTLALVSFIFAVSRAIMAIILQLARLGSTV